MKHIFNFKLGSYYKNQKERLKLRLKWFNIIKCAMPIKCKICGYDKVWHAMHFHHRNPEEKKFTISSMMRKKINKINVALMKKELKKCDCLCARCHMEIHKSKYDLIVDYNKIANVIGFKDKKEINKYV